MTDSVKPITSEIENEKALKIIEALMVKPSLTQAEDEYLEKLFSAVEDFERVAYPLSKKCCRSVKRKNG